MRKNIESIVESFFDNLRSGSDCTDWEDGDVDEIALSMYKELVERNAEYVLKNYDFRQLKFVKNAAGAIFNGNRLLLNKGPEYGADNIGGRDVGIITFCRTEKKTSQQPHVELAAVWCILGHHIEHMVDPSETWNHIYLSDSILGMIPEVEPVNKDPKYSCWNDGSDMCVILYKEGAGGPIVRVRAYEDADGNTVVKADAVFPISVFAEADKNIEKMQEALNSNPLI